MDKLEKPIDKIIDVSSELVNDAKKYDAMINETINTATTVDTSPPTNINKNTATTVDTNMQMVGGGISGADNKKLQEGGKKIRKRVNKTKNIFKQLGYKITRKNRR
jgi:hypothetical protein